MCHVKHSAPRPFSGNRAAGGYNSLMFIIFASALVVLDQLTKAWSKRTFGPGESQPLPLGFNFTYVENTGAAFGMFRNLAFDVFGFRVDGVILLGLLSGVVAAVLLFQLLKKRRSQPLLLRAALTLILAGAVGNMIDRFAHRFVVDFIHFRVGSFDFPVFNVADICVVAGAGLLFVYGFGGAEQARETETGTDVP